MGKIYKWTELMGKRSDFKRIDKDFYTTPKKAILPLYNHLFNKTENFNIDDISKYSIIEPCSGDLKLVNHLSNDGFNVTHSDLYNHLGIELFNAIDARTNKYDIKNNTLFITNPPWDRKLLHPIIENLSNQAPTWLLFDSDWLFTKQAKQFKLRLSKVVSVGRIKWFEDSKTTGKDNCMWALFDKPDVNRETKFFM